MSTIDTSGIDASVPVLGNPTTASVRDNFAEIITQLNNAGSDIDGLATPDAVIAGLAGVTINANEIHYATGLNTYDVTALTPWARTELLAAVDGNITSNMGLKGTPRGDLWASGAWFQIGSATYLTGPDYTGGNHWLDTSVNAYFSDAWRYVDAGEASIFELYNGNLWCARAEVGVADDPISWETTFNIYRSGGVTRVQGTVIDNDTAMAGNSIYKLATQYAIKSYVDNHPTHWAVNGTDLYYDTGNVGIGVTTFDSWNASATALQMGATSALWNWASGQTHLTENVYYDGVGYKYQTTSHATEYKQVNGTHVFSVAPSGTLDTAISWTTALTIDNGGHTIFPTGGDAATPTLAFGDGDTGFYQPSDGVVFFSSNGAARLGFNSNAIWAQQNGESFYLAGATAASATAPTLIPRRSDLTTGIGAATSGTLSLITGGVQRIRLGDSGGVHIAEIATAETNVAAYGQLWIRDDAPNTLMFTDDAGTDYAVAGAGVGGGEWTVSGTDLLQLTAGLTDVYFSDALTDATPLAQTLHGQGGAGTDIAGADITIAGGQGTGTGAGGEIIFRTALPGTTGSSLNALADRMIIDDAGNIGFNLPPLATSHADETSLLVGGLINLYGASDGSAGKSLILGHNMYRHTSGVERYIITDEASYYKQSAGGHSFEGVTTGTADTAISWVNQLVLTTNEARFGPGSIKLGERASAYTDTTAFGQVWVRDDAPNTLMFTDDDGTDYVVAGSTVSASPWVTTGSDIYYDTGHVGIGVTAFESWISGFSALQIGENNSLLGESSAGAGKTFYMLQNAFHSGTNWTYQDTDEASKYSQNSGTHLFEVAASGTAETTISWTTALTLNNDGSALLNGITIAGASEGYTDSFAIGTQNPIVSANYSMAIGDDAAARGIFSMAIGRDADARENSCIAIGKDSQAGQTNGGSAESNALAVGLLAIAYEHGCVAIGESAVAGVNGTSVDPDATAIGSHTDATGDGAVAIGTLAQALADQSVAIGDTADARETANVAIGYNSQAGNSAGGTSEAYATAIGGNSYAYEANTIAIGGGRAGQSGLTASPNAISIGNSSFADQAQGIAIGYQSEARGGNTIAIGQVADARESNCIVIGANSQAGQADNGFSERFAIAIGDSNNSYEEYCIAIGSNSVAGKNGTSLDPNAIAIGRNATAAEENSIAMGYLSEARGTESLAFGDTADARELNNIAFGSGSRAGQNDGATAESHAMAIGTNSRAYNSLSVAIGNSAAAGTDLSAVEEGSVAIGASSSSTKLRTVAIGASSIASSDYGVSIGYQAYAYETSGIAIGQASQAGENTGGTTEINAIAIGNGALARGKGSIALGAGAATNIGSDNLMIIGGSTEEINHVYIGKGQTNATPIAVTLQNTGASGTNIAGADFHIGGGPSTGSGIGGSVVIQTSPAGAGGSGANALVDTLTVDGNSEVLLNQGVLKINEQAAANSDTAGYGQLWVKNETPNELWFTDDAGNDTQLTGGSGTGPVLQTPTATTSGTSHDYTSIPSWVTRIVIMLDEVSLSGTAEPIIQIGDSGGIENTGYVGGASQIDGSPFNQESTAGFIVSPSAAADSHSGLIVLSLMDSSNNIWAISGNVFTTTGTLYLGVMAGSKSLSAALDRIRLTSTNGTDTFDNGSFNITWE